MTDYAVVTIGNSVSALTSNDSGLTSNDVDYLVSPETDVGSIISTAISNNLERNRSRTLIVLFYPGNYTLSSSITWETTYLPNNICLYGVGQYSSDVTFSMATSLSMFLNISASEFIYIKNITVDIKSDSNITSKLFPVTDILDMQNVNISGTYKHDLYLFDILSAGTKINLTNVKLNVESNEDLSTPACYLLLHDTMNGDGTTLNMKECVFEDSSSRGFQWLITTDNIDIRNCKFNLQCSEGSGTIFNDYKTLTLINNDFLDDNAAQETAGPCYLLTVPATHNRLVILNNIMRKDSKSGTLLSATSENNLKDYDIYDFNVIVEY